MKRLLLIFGLALATSLWFSCEKDPDSSSDNGSDVEDGVNHEETSDYTWDPSSEITITLNGSSITTSSSLVTINGSTATITAAGNYNISGSLSDGRLIVDAGNNDLVRLILNSATISNSLGPAILIEKSQKTIINLSEGTQNTLSDGVTYANPADDPNAAIFSKSDLTIFGAGSLTVNGKYKDGITSKDGLLLKSGTIISTAIDDGIRGKDYLVVEGGTITVNSGGDGLKSDNDANSGVGYILIEDGTIKVTAAGDGIAAQTSVTVTGGDLDIKTGGGSTSIVSGDVSAKGIKGLVNVTLAPVTCIINSADDAIHSNSIVVINAGTFSLSTSDDAIHADAEITVNDGTIAVAKCYEGLESHVITVNKGDITISSTDDCFNATAGTRTEQDDKSWTYINGGRIAVSSQKGDPLDSNGSMSMTGGTVVCHGPASQPNVAIDYNGTFNITGGMLVAAGPSSNMFQGFSTTSSQASIKVIFKSSVSASTIFHIQDSNGNEVVTFKPIRNYLTMVFSSPALVKGSTYNIYKSGSSTGTLQDGLYSGGTYTPGTLVSTFTISGSVTSLSNL